MAWYPFRTFLNELRGPTLPPVICLLGSDLYLRNKILDAVQAKMGGKKIEREIVYASEADPQKVVYAAQTYSMFSREKIMLVLQFNTWKAEQREQALAYLEKPNPDTALIFVTDTPPTDYHERLGFVKWYRDRADKMAVVDMSGFRPEEIKGMIKDMVREMDKRITDDALDLILETLDPLPEVIYQELCKIVSYLGAGKLITPEAVSEMVMGNKLQNIFDLSDALGRRDFPASFSVYQKMYSSNPTTDTFWFLGILGIIRRQYRILFELQANLGAEGNLKEALDRYKIPFNLRRDYLRQAERFSRRELSEIFDELYRTEKELKSSAHERNLVLEHLLMKLCRPGKTISSEAR